MAALVTHHQLRQYFSIAFPLGICHAKVAKTAANRSHLLRGLSPTHVDALMVVYAFQEMQQPCRWVQLGRVCGKGKAWVFHALQDLRSMGFLCDMTKEEQYNAFKRHLRTDSYALTRSGSQVCRDYIREYISIYKDICDIDLKAMVTDSNL